MAPTDSDWQGDWLKNQQQFWQSWANMVGQSGSNPTTMGSNPFSPNMGSNPFFPDWSQTLDQWWRLVSPQASDPVSEMFQRIIETGKSFNKLAEQGYSLGQTEEGQDPIQSWLDNMQKGFEDWSKQISTNKFSLFDNKDSSIPEWMGLNKGALEIWDTVANSIGLGGVPDIPGLDKGKVEISRLLKSPALGQWREHQQQLQNITQLLIEFQEADQVYKLAFAQMGLRSIEALRQRLSNISSDEDKVSTVREFYDLWVDVNEEIYSEFTMTDEYQVIHGDFVNALMALRKETNALTEKLYKAANLPTRSELNTINKRLQEQRRENIQLRNEIKKLASQIASKTEKKTKPSSKIQAIPKQDKDLSKIKGVGPKIVEKLHTQGIETLEQIAKMQLAELEKLDKQIGGNGRILRDQWGIQANQLLNQ
ncbi:MAG: class III poly(R)-hydroxyalkanoic acid synthase subunit PhaE [Gammaproteobacteria bacterium]|nr:class III poly(R)-hydroxyalkanoic acid synthase subunit PhaE [Gammaproteobacteria bacterium]